MLNLEFLQALHERLEPRTYLEIGVAEGHSLALSRCRSIGIDPAFAVTQELVAPVSLFRATSDAYFARLRAQRATPFGELPVDFGYIDGMHHFECALRDFIAIERYATPASVVAFDDVLPRDAQEAARERQSANWAGDVFRIRVALATHRPDLRLICVKTRPTGTLLVTQLDPSSGVLAERLEDIVEEYVEPDPQPIPAEVLERKRTLTPRQALALKIWDRLKGSRQLCT